MIQKPDFMRISFDVPKNSTVGVTDLCVKISGPKEYLPQFTEATCQVNSYKNNHTAVLTSLILAKKDMEFCKDGLQTKVTFDPKDNENFAHVGNTGARISSGQVATRQTRRRSGISWSERIRSTIRM